MQRVFCLLAAAGGLMSCQLADDGAPVFEIEPEPGPAPVAGKADGADLLPPPQARYHDFGEVESFLFDVNNAFPEIARLGVYGESPQGRPLYALAIERDVSFADDPARPNVLLNFSIHGDELITVESAMAVIHHLVTGYVDEDPRVTEIVDSVELFVVPVVSPDGFAAQSRTVQGVDPNRQFPFPGDPTPQAIGIIEDAQALYGFFRFEGVLDVHAFGELVMLPWGGSFDPSPRFDELAEVGLDLAQGVGYTPGQISHLFNTTAQGGSADWYHREGALAIGIELGRAKVPPVSRIPVVAGEATEIVLRFVEHFG